MRLASISQMCCRVLAVILSEVRFFQSPSKRPQIMRRRADSRWYALRKLYIFEFIYVWTNGLAANGQRGSTRLGGICPGSGRQEDPGRAPTPLLAGPSPGSGRLHPGQKDPPRASRALRVLPVSLVLEMQGRDVGLVRGLLACWTHCWLVGRIVGLLHMYRRLCWLRRLHPAPGEAFLQGPNAGLVGGLSACWIAVHCRFVGLPCVVGLLD